MVQGIQPSFKLGNLTLKSQALLLAGHSFLLAFNLPLAQGVKFGFFVTEGPLSMGHGLLCLGQIGLPYTQAFGSLPEYRFECRERIP